MTIPTVVPVKAASLTSSRTVLARLLRPAVLVAAGFLLLLIVLALFAPLIAPYDPAAQDLLGQFKPPSLEHLLGTDHLGRDVFTRLVYATRLTLLAPLISVGVAVVLALALVGTVGFILGPVLWLIAYGVFHAIGRALLRMTDPDIL